MDRDRKYMRLVSWKGEKLLGTDRIRVKVGENISGWVADRGSPDQRCFPGARIGNPPGHRLHALRAPDQRKPCPGVISATSEKKAAFSLDDMELMMTLAGLRRGADQQCPPLRSDERGAQRRRRRSGEFAQRDYRQDQQKKITTFNRRAEEIPRSPAIRN